VSPGSVSRSESTSVPGHFLSASPVEKHKLSMTSTDVLSPQGQRWGRLAEDTRALTVSQYNTPLGVQYSGLTLPGCARLKYSLIQGNAHICKTLGR
jgi:hypothetical protein